MWHGYPDAAFWMLFALKVAFPTMGEDGGVSDTINVSALLPAVPANAEEAVAATLLSAVLQKKVVSARVTTFQCFWRV